MRVRSQGVDLLNSPVAENSLSAHKLIYKQ
jgi:hypothetical protein